MFLPAIDAFNLPALNARDNLQRQLYPSPVVVVDSRLVCTFDQRNHGHRQVDHRAK